MPYTVGSTVFLTQGGGKGKEKGIWYHGGKSSLIFFPPFFPQKPWRQSCVVEQLIWKENAIRKPLFLWGNKKKNGRKKILYNCIFIFSPSLAGGRWWKRTEKKRIPTNQQINILFCLLWYMIGSINFFLSVVRYVNSIAYNFLYKGKKGLLFCIWFDHHPGIEFLF